MQDKGLPQETIRFIDAHITSVSQLEMLLLLQRSGEVLTAVQINEEQRSSLHSIEQGLASLVAHGLVAEVERSGSTAYRYSPTSDELAQAANLLADIYSTCRVRVIAAIYSPTDPMQSFTDAFRMRKEPESNG